MIQSTEQLEEIGTYALLEYADTGRVPDHEKIATRCLGLPNDIPNIELVRIGRQIMLQLTEHIGTPKSPLDTARRLGIEAMYTTLIDARQRREAAEKASLASPFVE